MFNQSPPKFCHARYFAGKLHGCIYVFISNCEELIQWQKAVYLFEQYFVRRWQNCKGFFLKLYKKSGFWLQYFYNLEGFNRKLGTLNRKLGTLNKKLETFN